ncbi:Putative geranyl diphosphate synthase / farnesyl diphosphate synthase, partial [Candidatus Arthromitus sp. SFB-3]
VKLSEYAHYIGLTFQIIDDILDKTSDTQTLGKTSNIDNRNKKFTYVDLYGIDECKKICEENTNKAINILNSLDKDVSNLIDFTKYMLNRKF